MIQELPEDLKACFEKCLRAQREAEQKGFPGFKWQDANVPPWKLHKLLDLGFLKVVYKSRSKTRYAIVKEALENKKDPEGQFLRVWLSKEALKALRAYMEENDIWDMSQAVEELILRRPRRPCPRSPCTSS